MSASTCPGCGGPMPQPPVIPALSRFDNATDVCEDCGMFEARAVRAGFELVAPGQTREVSPGGDAPG